MEAERTHSGRPFYREHDLIPIPEDILALGVEKGGRGRIRDLALRNDRVRRDGLDDAVLDDDALLLQHFRRSHGDDVDVADDDRLRERGKRREQRGREGE